MKSITAKTTSGILWSFSEQLARRGIGIIVTLLLARFLVPEDFGLIAMMSFFLAIGGSLMDSGFREALIRLNNITHEDYTTAFFANLLLGLISYGVLFMAAPAIASFYNEPRLVELVRVSAMTIIVMSFQVVQVASLSRKLNFKVQLKTSLPASVVSGSIAVCLAYIGWGVWALVIQSLLQALLHTVLLWCVEGWRPTYKISWPSLKAMYSFGHKLFLAGMLDTIFQNLYVIVIAKVFSASVAGLYFFAYKIKELIVQQLVSSIQKVTYPALASMQDDNTRLKQGYKKIVILMTMVLFPTVLFTAALAKPMFQILLPENWLPAVPYFELLCIASLMMPLHSINLNILKVKGRSDLFLYLEFVKKLVVVFVLLMTYQYGVYAVLLGQILTSCINYIPNSYFSSKLLSYGLREQVGDFMPVMIVSFISAGTGYAFVHTLEWHPVMLVIFSLMVMVSVFVALSLLMNKRNFSIAVTYFISVFKIKRVKRVQ